MSEVNFAFKSGCDSYIFLCRLLFLLIVCFAFKCFIDSAQNTNNTRDLGVSGFQIVLLIALPSG